MPPSSSRLSLPQQTYPFVARKRALSIKKPGGGERGEKRQTFQGEPRVLFSSLTAFVLNSLTPLGYHSNEKVWPPHSYYHINLPLPCLSQPEKEGPRGAARGERRRRKGNSSLQSPSETGAHEYATLTAPPPERSRLPPPPFIASVPPPPHSPWLG